MRWKRIYESHGVRAWTVWVPDHDRESARLLAARGHALDAAPRAMAMELADLGAGPPAPAGIDPGPIGAAACAELNDLAYGYGPDGFRAGLAGETSIRWHGAFDDAASRSAASARSRSAKTAASPASPPRPSTAAAGSRAGSCWRALAEARERGLATASLQATRAGAPLYERLGFRDLGFIEMWELRR